MVDLPPEPSPGSSLPLTEDDWLAKIPELKATPGDQKTSAEDAPPDSTGGKPRVDSLEEQHVEDAKQNRNLRGEYAEKAYSLACACLWGWGMMLFATGIVNGVRGHELWSDKVLIAVTSGVTVSVLAAFLGVIRGLFPNGNSKEPPKSSK